VAHVGEPDRLQPFTITCDAARSPFSWLGTRSFRMLTPARRSVVIVEMICLSTWLNHRSEHVLARQVIRSLLNAGLAEEVPAPIDDAGYTWCTPMAQSKQLQRSPATLLPPAPGGLSSGSVCREPARRVSYLLISRRWREKEPFVAALPAPLLSRVGAVFRCSTNAHVVSTM
jgi:hypothetical protein